MTLSHVTSVFEIYQAVRLQFAQSVVQNAAKIGLMYEFNSPGLYDGFSVSTASDAENDANLYRDSSSSACVACACASGMGWL